MTSPGAGLEYSMEEIQRLLKRIRAEDTSAPTTPGSAPINKPSTLSQPQSRPALGVTRELSLDEILQKVQREISDGGPTQPNGD